MLGDRIAIMADGHLKTGIFLLIMYLRTILFINQINFQSVGSSFFLKKRFGVGYRLVLVKKATCNPQIVVSFLSKYIPEIAIETNIGTELTFVLNDNYVRDFKTIFKDLETNLDSLNILSFGLSLTTMEEVFLK